MRATWQDCREAGKRGLMRILVAEDDSASATILRLMLGQMGHDVVEATDGAEAWRLFQAEPFRLVISDWTMPELDGPGLCRRIREHPGKGYVYIILHTAKREPADRQEGLRAGANAFLPKPVVKRELEVLVETAVAILAARDRRG
jgi:CheY-like chemotaxis protein